MVLHEHLLFTNDGFRSRVQTAIDDDWLAGWMDGWHKGERVVTKGCSSFSLVSKHVYFAFAFTLSSFSLSSTKSTSLSRTSLRTRPGKRKKPLSSQGHAWDTADRAGQSEYLHPSILPSQSKIVVALLSVSERDLSQCAIGDVCMPWSHYPCTVSQA